jgi:hypothetical protein
VSSGASPLIRSMRRGAGTATTGFTLWTTTGYRQVTVNKTKYLVILARIDVKLSSRMPMDASGSFIATTFTLQIKTKKSRRADSIR